MKKILNQLQEEIHRMRLGSQSILSILENIRVKCYGTFLPMIEISTINIVDHMNLTIEPWDRTLISNIDKAVIDANLGFMPTNKGNLLYIHLPILTEESRINLMKRIKTKIEKSKILIRTVRKKNNQSIKQLKLSDDLSKIGENHIQKTTKEYIQKIEILFHEKEKEILNI
ncbi:ribosome-recycling factor [Blattabacterium cuenoti]|nr:ribosome-recycling factor [Blattabacterium cuenoti]